MSTHMKDLIKCALFTPGPRGWGLPLMFYGAPGVAKSDIIETAAREAQIHCEVLSPGERGEGQFGVVPVPIKRNDDKYVLSYPKPDFCDIFDDEGRGVLFLDEFNTAPRAVRPAMLGLIQARRLGSSYLGQGVRVLGAMNPVGSSAGGDIIPKATANRLIHIDWEAPEASEWTEWLITHDSKHMEVTAAKTFDPAEEEKRVLKAWDMANAKAKGVVAGFIKARPEMLAQEPQDEDPKASGPWPSRRTWYLVTLAMTAAEIHHLDPMMTQMLISGCVGPAAALEMMQYFERLDLPDPVQLLDGKIKWKHDQERLDRTMAVLSACSAIVCSEDKKLATKDRISKFWELIGTLTGDMRDVALVAATPAIKKDVGTENNIEVDKILARLTPLTQAVGNRRR